MIHSLHRLPTLTAPLIHVLAVALLISTASARTPQMLVTEQEAAASRAAPEPLVARAVPAPDSPRISLLAPNLSSAVPSPTRIHLRFEPTAPATIRPESFKVRYGTFRIDITDRITASSRVTPDGIDVAQASLPKGSHRLQIEILDSLGRAGQQQMQFVVD
jgi:hypothetical protein